jgi:hypothetical protein
VRRILIVVFACSLLFVHGSTMALAGKTPEPPREDKVTYQEALEDHPALAEMVDEAGFNSLSGPEQWELITLVDKYSFFQQEGEYYAGESPGQSMLYLQRAKSIMKDIQKRFGHVLKK